MSDTPPINDLPSDAIKPIDVVFTAEELTALVDEIIASGELGRSRVYADLLRFLVKHSDDKRGPKEIEIALEVLGKDTDFDVTKDSAVRVYIHQLRKKLDRYYAKHDGAWQYRLSIPKGQYMVVAEASESPVLATDTNEPGSVNSFKLLPWSLAAIAILLFAHLIFWFAKPSIYSDQQSLNASDNPLWESILTDDRPILVVIGDYYIFGEVDEVGNISRMVRDFAINSRDDLETSFNQQPQLAWRYVDLDLTYLPEGSAFALNSILPTLHSSAKPITIKMMSELTTDDMQSSHVVYVGYVSAMGRLNKLLFNASRLRVGENYDELVDTATDLRYNSDAGMPAENRAFVDYGLLASFSLTDTNRLIVVAGLRDAGLVHAAHSAVKPDALQKLATRMQEIAPPDLTAFEALYEVRGVDRTNFSAALLFASPINAQRLWNTTQAQ